MENPRIQYGMYLAVLPQYRTACMTLLHEDLGSDLRAWVSSAHLDPTVKTDTQVSWYESVRMVRIARQFFIQLGSFGSALRVQSLILDLNPRSATAWALLLARRTLRRRSVVWGHLYPQAGAGANMRVLRRAMRRLASGTLTYTYSDWANARSDLPGKPAWVAPNSLYPSSVISPAVSDAVRTDVLYVGRLVEGKKVALLIRAFAEVASSDSDAHLTLVGAGEHATTLRALAEELGISDRVTYPGWVSDPRELREYYAKAFVSVSPGFVGLGLTQSLGFGIPMIVSRTEKHSPEVELAEWGGVEWFETDSAASLAQALQKAKSRSTALPDIRLSDHIRHTYSAEAMAKGIKDALLGNVRAIDD
jgi:glycosyltransferase involved in cell wall biosynthesis